MKVFHLGLARLGFDIYTAGYNNVDGRMTTNVVRVDQGGNQTVRTGLE